MLSVQRVMLIFHMGTVIFLFNRSSALGARTGFADRSDKLARSLFFQLSCRVAAADVIVLLARLAFMPRYVVRRPHYVAAVMAVHHGVLVALLVDLTGAVSRTDTMPEVRIVLESVHDHETVVPVAIFQPSCSYQRPMVAIGTGQ